MQVYAILVDRLNPQQPEQKTKHQYQINPDLQRCWVINKRLWAGFPLSALTQDISAIPYTRRLPSWGEDILGHQIFFLWCENCGGLKGNAPLGSYGVGLSGGVVFLEYLWSCWRRYGHVGGDMVLLEEVYHGGVGFEISDAQVRLSGLLSLPAECRSSCRTLSFLLSITSSCLLPWRQWPSPLKL